MPDRSDEELIDAIAAHDEGAFRTFVVRHQDRTWRCVRALCASDEAAEEALQESFLGVWRGASQWRGDHAPRAWLLGMARRQAARTWRRRAQEPTHLEALDDATFDDLGAAAGFGGDPESATAQAEDISRVEAALAQLSPQDREILVLRDIEGLTGPEVAAALDLNLATMKTRLHRARLRLMSLLREGALHD